MSVKSIAHEKKNVIIIKFIVSIYMLNIFTILLLTTKILQNIIRHREISSLLVVWSALSRKNQSYCFVEKKVLIVSPREFVISIYNVQRTLTFMSYNVYNILLWSVFIFFSHSENVISLFNVCTIKKHI